MEGKVDCVICKTDTNFSKHFSSCGCKDHNKCINKWRLAKDYWCPHCVQDHRCDNRKTVLLRLIEAGKCKKRFASEYMAFFENLTNYQYGKVTKMGMHDVQNAVELIDIGWNPHDFWGLLLAACRKDDLEKFNRLIKLGIQFNNEFTICAAVNAKTFKVFDRIMELGIDLKEYGQLALIEACRNKESHVVSKYLVVNGVNVNSVINHRSPLKMAAYSQSHEMVEYLLENGADPNLAIGKDTWVIMKYTVLHFYGQYIDDIPVELLCKYKAKFNFKNNYDKSPLYYAMDHGSVKRCKSLIEAGTDLKRQVWKENSFLHMACYRPNLYELIPAILDQNVDVNCKNSRGNTPLHICAFTNNHRAARMLLLAGADITIKNNRNNAPIDIAKMWDHQEILMLLESDDMSKKFDFEEEESELAVRFYQMIDFFVSLLSIELFQDTEDFRFGFRSQIWCKKVLLIESISKLISKSRHFMEIKEEQIEILLSLWEDMDRQMFFDAESNQEFENFSEIFLTVTTEIIKKIFKKLAQAIWKYAPIREYSYDPKESVHVILEKIDLVDLKRCNEFNEYTRWDIYDYDKIIWGISEISDKFMDTFDCTDLASHVNAKFHFKDKLANLFKKKN